MNRNSSTYVQRKAESRALDDRIYRLRYVIPKDFKGADIAKKPEKNYVLQESKSILEQQIPASGIPVDQPVIYNRNPRIIAGITTDASDGLKNVVVTETPHKLSVNDGVKIKNVRSSTNTGGTDNSGYNGLFTVTRTPSSKSFTYTNTNLGGTFVTIVTAARKSEVVFHLQTYQHLKEVNMIHHIQYKKSKQFKNIFQTNKMVFSI